MKTPLFTFSDAYLAIASPGFAEATIGPLARREAKRPAVQAVTYCTSRKTVLLLRDNHGNIELPGGGMKSSENTETAIRRELLQEAGIGEIESIAVIARSTEIRKRTNFQQNNTGLLVTVNNPAVHTTHLSKRELATGWGFEPLWQPLGTAVETIGDRQPESYGAHFKRTRDLWLITLAWRKIEERFAS